MTMKTLTLLRLAAAAATAVILLGFGNAAAYSANPPNPKKLAAIVIDDFGNNMPGTREMIDLPFPITVAVMPYQITTKRDAKWAYAAGDDVLVHLPMEPLSGSKRWLGPEAITSDLSEDEIRRRVNRAIDDVPYAIGINNHMGSKITGDRRIMNIILEVCRKRRLLILDSHTNYRSVVGEQAEKLGVPFIENHIFLDDIRSRRHVYKQLQLMKEHLQDHNPCVVIGHVGGGGKRTAAALHDFVPILQENVRFVTISHLVPPYPGQVGLSPMERSHSEQAVQ